MTTGITRRLQNALLMCGILATLAYLTGDAIGGLRYPGYSFTSQTISELVAIEAPSRPVTNTLFMIYSMLAGAFGVGVLWRAGHDKRVRLTGALFVGSTIFGGIGYALAPVHVRGAGTLASAMPHTIVTAGVVLLLLATIVAGAFALGKRFRLYSWATLFVMLGTSALAFPQVSRIAANLPTPGLGIYERIDVYASMVWIAILAFALLRRSVQAAAPIGGSVAPGFEEVRAEFERNFRERGEIGAAVAVYWRGRKVVDLWGGRRAPKGADPWNEDTMVVVMSATKGLAAMTLAVANARGWLDYDAPVARYWPEFARNGKAAITVRQLLAHEAGLVLLDEKLTIEQMRELDYVAHVLARQQPAWQPGTRHGYHALTIGLYMQELIRHIDPHHRTLGQFFREEIAEPLGLEFYIGLPSEVPETRLARIKPLSTWRALLALRTTPPLLIRKVLNPRSLLRKSMAVPSGLDFTQRPWLEVELPAGNGVGTARAIARAYSAFAEGGAELGITAQTFKHLTTPAEVTHPIDEVIGVPTFFSLGFARPGPRTNFGSSPRAFGAPGAGGSFAFADPDAHIGYAYVMNKLDFWLVDDPREKALRDAVYRAISRLAYKTRAKPLLPVELLV